MYNTMQSNEAAKALLCHAHNLKMKREGIDTQSQQRAPMSRTPWHGMAWHSVGDKLTNHTSPSATNCEIATYLDLILKSLFRIQYPLVWIQVEEEASQVLDSRKPLRSNRKDKRRPQRLLYVWTEAQRVLRHKVSSALTTSSRAGEEHLTKPMGQPRKYEQSTSDCNTSMMHSEGN